jgi:hypothetical protein
MQHDRLVKSSSQFTQQAQTLYFYRRQTQRLFAMYFLASQWPTDYRDVGLPDMAPR